MRRSIEATRQYNRAYKRRYYAEESELERRIRIEKNTAAKRRRRAMNRERATP